jgi:hypothetical protein
VPNGTLTLDSHKLPFTKSSLEREDFFVLNRFLFHDNKNPFHDTLKKQSPEAI